MSEISHNERLREKIHHKLKTFDRVEAQKDGLTAAAVVIGISILANSTNAGILLTRRSSKLRKHAGQYALPGGKVDNGESLVEAALRELQEELNLNEAESSVLGFLDDMPTQSGFNITPVVVWIDNLNSLKPNPDEVAEVYQIPLEELETISLNLSHEDPTPEQGRSESAVMSLYLPSVGTTVYSPTAAIIYQFREVAMRGIATRVAHFGQPRFAWR